VHIVVNTLYLVTHSLQLDIIYTTELYVITQSSVIYTPGE